MITQAQTRQTDDGATEAAVKYYQPGRVYIQAAKTTTGKEYVAITRANICLAWVDSQDVEKILTLKGGCCGKNRQLFYLANADDVRRWTNNGGR